MINPDWIQSAADQIVDQAIYPEVMRHVNCGCHQCMQRAQSICDDWLHGIDAVWMADTIKEYWSNHE